MSMLYIPKDSSGVKLVQSPLSACPNVRTPVASMPCVQGLDTSADASSWLLRNPRRALQPLVQAMHVVCHASDTRCRIQRARL